MSSRQAALLVHALDDADRSWVLSQLPAPQQERMQSLLSELGELGIPEDRGLVEAALSAKPKTSPMPTDDEGFVCAVAAHEVVHALRAEPTAFVRKLLGCRDWPWAAAVAQELALPLALGGGGGPTTNAAAFRRCATRLLAERLRSAGAAPQAVDRAAAAASPQPWHRRLQALWRTAS